MNEPNTTPNIDSAFLNTLQMMRGGAVISDLSEALRKVTTAVRAEAKPGVLTLTLTFKPSGGGALNYVEEITTKLPKSAKQSTLAFVTEDGALQRNDPNQQELPLRTVQGGVTEAMPLKTVAAVSA